MTATGKSTREGPVADGLCWVSALRSGKELRTLVFFEQFLKPQ